MQAFSLLWGGLRVGGKCSKVCIQGSPSSHRNIFQIFSFHCFRLDLLHLHIGALPLCERLMWSSLLIQAPDPLAPPGLHVTPPSAPALSCCLLYSIGVELLKAVPGLTSNQQGWGLRTGISIRFHGVWFPCCSGVPLGRVHFSEGPCCAFGL